MGTMMKVDNDEYCLNCEEWREYDKDGRCILCGSIIKKNQMKSKSRNFDEYELSDFNGGNFYDFDETVV